MEYSSLLEFMALSEKLKCNTRHSWTTDGRKESVAEHTYRLGIFAWLVKEEFQDIDMDRVMKMCLFHDIGEAVTGDVPSFLKGAAEEEKEAEALKKIIQILPEPHQKELADMIEEIEKNETREAKLVHALDKMEAVIQHNEAPIHTWLPLEYELNQVYGESQAAVFEYTRELRKVLKAQTIEKIKKADQQ